MTVYRSRSAGSDGLPEPAPPAAAAEPEERGWFEPPSKQAAAEPTETLETPEAAEPPEPPEPAKPPGNGRVVARAAVAPVPEPPAPSAPSAPPAPTEDEVAADALAAAAEHIGEPRPRKTRLEEELEPVIAGGREPGAGWRTALRSTGEVLITLGLVVLLFAGYEIWGKSAQVTAAQTKLDDKLEENWKDEPDRPPDEPPLPGAAIARLYIPRLNKHWVVVEGTKQEDIKNAPGHYPKTAMPGQLGNFAVAGHRMPAIWWDLDQVQPGDAIIVETRDRWWVYRVTKNYVIDPHKISVVAPNPDNPRAAPAKAMLTLTTCNPKWDNYERLVVHAELANGPEGRPKSEGRPPELPR